MTEHIYETKLVAQNGWEIHFPINNASPKEEIIRCRDCKYHDDLTHESMCKRFSDDEIPHIHHVYTEPDGFCAWGDTND